MTTSAETTTGDPGTTIACLIIRTGRSDCYAHFYPALYQLTLVRNGVEEKIDLGYSGSRLLERLLHAPGEVVSREELMSHAWADRVVGQGSLNQQIYTLRQVLADEKSREIIQTLPRRGYLLNPAYLTNAPAAEEIISADAEEPPPPPAPPFIHRHRRQRASWVILLAALALLVMAQFGYLYQLSQPRALHSSEMKLGTLTVRYLDQESSHLQQLILQTHVLTSRLAALARQPAELTLRLRGDFYELLCQQVDGSARSLMFHESQLSHIADAQLSGCLP